VGKYQKELARPWELTMVPHAVDCGAGSLVVGAAGAATEREQAESSSSGCHHHSWRRIYLIKLGYAGKRKINEWIPL